ncbi:hypothetical protein E1301_Tti006318 [Triplophysa tibetana]|uniref:Ig-like domain-containing protein n=1 Tax=Triplophysa tibetana TaxID=1572043 RepID=A0A5A9NQY1_9TELE|nr:hypothetical protein E1301_Tti006318 [Triplophysa tibetana]
MGKNDTLMIWNRTAVESDVKQEPKILWRQTSGSATMNCTHNKGTTYYQMYWYRQRPGETMRLIVFTTPYAEADFGDVDKNKFDVLKNVPEFGSLTVKHLNSSTADGSDVSQTPSIIYEPMGSSVQINCTQYKGSTYRLMYWYKQRQGKTMRLVAFTTSYTSPEYEDPLSNKFLANKSNPENGSLTVKNLEADDEAIYFCSSPGNVIRNQNESAVIECEHNIPSYNLLLWYKQTKNLFTLMGYLYLTTENKEPGFVTKTKLDGDARKNGTLTIKTLTLNESSVLSHDVSQSPSDVFKAKGDDAKIECKHNISSYNVILWYKQTLDNGLKLLGHLQYKNNQTESEFLNKIHLKGDATSNGLLVIKDVSGDDSAVYFCAASSHSDTDTACHGKGVVQTPGDLLQNPTETAVIICTHDIPSYDRILWYKQEFTGFKLMGYLNLQYDNPEPDFKDKIKLIGDGRTNGKLIINSTTLSDSAMYFCAAYDTVIRITSVLYNKPPQFISN